MDITIRRTEVFSAWLRGVPDKQTRNVITARLGRLAQGNPGDAKSAGGGVWELRIDFGPGYRVYYVQRGSTIVLILCGGDKSTQKADILRVRRLAAEWKENSEWL
jgi:putative addiction module killer protein